MRLINLKNTIEKNYIYIGRPSIYGNPFKLSLYSREESVKLYAQLVWRAMKRQEPLAEAIEKLKKDDVLACFCTPLACHGDVIIKAWKYIHGYDK